MTITGIIAEYNPFHSGHEYQIREARRRTGADYIIAIMSGDFVQRGAPACMDKYTRAEAALRGGADLVLELPAAGACASAETFAMTGVSILDRLGCVDYLSFGCESADPASLSAADEIAGLFANETEAFRDLLLQYIKEGMSFPKARAASAAEVLAGSDETRSLQIRQILANPNDLLSIEYRKALLRLSSKIRPCPILRLGSGYHESVNMAGGRDAGPYGLDPVLMPDDFSQAVTETDDPAVFSSAEEIRRILFEKDAAYVDFSSLRIPDYAASLYRDYLSRRPALREDDFSLLLHAALLRAYAPGRSNTRDEDDLDRRIDKHLEDFSSWSRMIGLIRQKNRTYTAASRRLLSILLDISREDESALVSCSYAPYARILGFKNSASSLVSRIQQAAEIPVFSSLAKALREDSDPENSAVPLLNSEQRRLLLLDLRASALYSAVLTAKTGQPRINELRRKLLRI